MDFNDFVCPVCGSVALVPSTITLQANYGSQHDMECAKIELCGECFDKLLGIISIFNVTLSENGITTPIFDQI